MKRFLTGLLTLVMLLALAAPACADILWEPNYNSFYEKHRDDCTYHGRGYYANSQKGYVTIWDAPGGFSVKGQRENGAELWVYWLYEDWGLVSYRDGDSRTEGWAPMADLLLIYDYISFAEEYAGQITPYDGEFADYEGDAAGVAFYEYPGAPHVKRYMEFGDQGDVKKNLTGTADEASYIQSVFVDENGLTWGFVGYMYGRMNAWFCLNDPEGDGDPAEEAEQAEPVFPVREVEQPQLTPAQEPVLPAAGYIPYLLVGVVMIVTAVILGIFFRKKKPVS